VPDRLGDDPADSVPDRLEQATVAVLGLTYRAGVRETRASPGIDICEELADRGADVLAADPLVDAEGVPATDVAIEELPDHAPDAAVLATAHEAFDAVDWDAMPPAVVVDSRDVLALSDTDHRQYTVGRGWS
jgi:UDP-N-acetyl-D-mannosaminuronic acid dehydrogenase